MATCRNCGETDGVISDRCAFCAWGDAIGDGPRGKTR